MIAYFTRKRDTVIFSQPKLSLINSDSFKSINVFLYYSVIHVEFKYETFVLTFVLCLRWLFIFGFTSTKDLLTFLHVELF